MSSCPEVSIDMALETGELASITSDVTPQSLMECYTDPVTKALEVSDVMDQGRDSIIALNTCGTNGIKERAVNGLEQAHTCPGLRA